MGAPLSVFRGRRRPGAKWTRLDRALFLGLQAYEDDCCTGCGTPRTYGMDPDSKGLLHVKSATCNGCAALDRENRKRGDKPAPPGQSDFVSPSAVLVHAMTYPIHVPPFPT